MNTQMQLTCDLDIANAYTSAAQRARVISESWFAANVYCLACDEEALIRSKPNTQATDFSCGSCGHRYELKTFRRRPGKSLVTLHTSLIAKPSLTSRADALFVGEG